LKPLLRPVIRALGIRRDRLPVSARGVIAQDYSSQYLVGALEASLRRLRTDYVDLFQLHSPPTEVVVRGEWQSALESLKSAGKIRHYGISCDSPEAALAALRYSGVASLQFGFSLLEPGAAETILPLARSQGVACIARECLGNGLLAKENAAQLDLAPYCSSAEQVELRKQQLADLQKQATDRGITLTRMAIEFASRSNGISVALVGARNPQQLRRLLDDGPA
jgi:aryl-alcohol dehydrogenase-like predicted oxidoreductase